MRVGVVGYGYWGPNLVRCFAESSACQLHWVCDRDSARLGKVQQRYPVLQTTTDIDDVLTDPLLDAVAIATPVHTHFPIAMRALEAGKNVLIEKPITETSEQARQLIEEAAKRRLVLMVGHTFCYTEAVRLIRDVMQAGKLGDVYYYDSTRINLGLFQHDVNVIWDLAVHDFSILDFLIKQRPVAVSANGISHLPNTQENVAFVTLFFDDSIVAHVNVNWLAPVKLRRTVIGGSERMIVFDDLEPTEKVKIYDCGVSVATKPEQIHEMLLSYRTGDMLAPNLKPTEALRTETEHFIDCIDQGKTPITDGLMGLRIVETLEAATQSMEQRGKPVPIGGQRL